MVSYTLSAQLKQNNLPWLFPVPIVTIKQHTPPTIVRPLTHTVSCSPMPYQSVVYLSQNRKEKLSENISSFSEVLDLFPF